MGWFGEQIRQRTESDRNIVEDSFLDLAGAILGNSAADHLKDHRLAAKDALNDILKYYRLGPVEVPDGVQDVMKEVDTLLLQTGLMAREVKLTDNWQNTAYGPLLGRMQDTETAVVLLPGAIYGYYYKDPVTGKKIRTGIHTAISENEKRRIRKDQKRIRNRNQKTHQRQPEQLN